LGSTPDPAGGAQCSPSPPSWILGALLLREGRGKKRMGEKGGALRGVRMGGDGKGRGEMRGGDGSTI